MRVVLPLFALMLTTAATAGADGRIEQRLPEPEIRELQPFSAPGEAVCRDRIHTVREERDLPRLERDTADPDDPLLIAAVDHRIDGCSVMVMKYDSSDVRPIPRPDENAPLLRPAR